MKEILKGWKRGLACALAAGLLVLAGCGADSGAQSGTGSQSGAAGSQSGAQSETQTGAVRMGLGLDLSQSAAQGSGAANCTAAAVLLDGDGKILRATLDVMENKLAAGGDGALNVPENYRSKREQGMEYGLAKVSSLGREWFEQADAFCAYVEGLTAEQAAQLETDDAGRATDVDLLSGCTIKIGSFQKALATACANANVLGSAAGDALRIGMVTQNAASNANATDDADGKAQTDTSIVALSCDAEGRVTGAVADVAEVPFTLTADGGFLAPENVQSKLTLGDGYGMRGASALGKEWYEHSRGFCDYLKGRNAQEIAGLAMDGSDADLAAVCTIRVTVLQEAVLKALKEENQTENQEENAASAASK